MNSDTKLIRLINPMQLLNRGIFRTSTYVNKTFYPNFSEMQSESWLKSNVFKSSEGRKRASVFSSHTVYSNWKPASPLLLDTQRTGVKRLAEGAAGQRCVESESASSLTRSRKCVNSTLERPNVQLSDRRCEFNLRNISASKASPLTVCQPAPPTSSKVRQKQVNSVRFSCFSSGNAPNSMTSKLCFRGELCNFLELN